MLKLLKRKATVNKRNKVYLVRSCRTEGRDSLYEIFHLLVESPDGTRYYETLAGRPEEIHDYDGLDFTVTARVVAWSRGAPIAKGVLIDLSKMENEIINEVDKNIKAEMG